MRQEINTADSPFGTNSSCSDRKSTRLNSSHSQISYAVFCLKKEISPIGTAMQISEGQRTVVQTLASFAGMKSKVPTAAESLALRFAADHGPSDAPDVDSIEH